MTLCRRLADALHAFRFGHTKRDLGRSRFARLDLLTRRQIARRTPDSVYLHSSETLFGLLEDARKNLDGPAYSFLACELVIDRRIHGQRPLGDHVGDERILDGANDAAGQRQPLSVAAGKRHRELNAGLYKGPIDHLFDRKFSLWAGNGHRLFLGVTGFVRRMS